MGTDAPEGSSGGSGFSIRLALSWLIVGVPLLYGVLQAVRSTLPLFGG